MFTNMQLASGQIGRDSAHRLPWAVAPKPFRDALENAEAAIVNVGDMQTAVFDAEIALNEAEAAWRTEAEPLVRAGKPLPAKADVEAAQFRIELARKDVAEAETRVRQTEAALAGEFENVELRDAWRDAMQKQLETDQARLAKLTPEILSLVERINQLHAYSVWLAVWPSAGIPAVSDRYEFLAELNRAQNVKLAERATPADISTDAR